MPLAIKMPQLDQDMKEGTVASWHVEEGKTVAKGDVLFEIETEKAAVEVEAEATGSLHHILTPAGSSAPVDAPVAWLYGESEEVGPEPPENPKPEDYSNSGPAPEDKTGDCGSPDRKRLEQTVVEQKGERSAVRSHPIPAGKGGNPPRPIATPAARSEAARRGVSLQELTGTGPGGRIQTSDVMIVSRAAPPPEPPAEMLETPPGPQTIPVLPERETGSLSVLNSGRGGGLPMVMIHGLFNDASAWTAIEKPLAGARKIHRIELPCHGRSPRRPPASFAELVSEVRTCFDKLELVERQPRCPFATAKLAGSDGCGRVFRW